MGLIPKNRFHIIKSFCIERRRKRDLAAYSAFASHYPKLRCLILQDYRYDRDDSSDDSSDSSSEDENDEQEQLVVEVFGRLLRSSRNSLEMMRIPANDLVRQVDLDSHVFPNLAFLSLEIPEGATKEERYIHVLLFKYKFDARFPYLKSVEFKTSPRRVNLVPPLGGDNKEVEEGRLELLPKYPCVSVRSLILAHNATKFSLEFGSALFPNLTELHVRSEKSDVGVPYGKIWAEFPHLEILSAREPFWELWNDRQFNYDAEFLGISEEEAKGLRKLDLKAVKTMHIVPTMPSIMTTKSKDLMYYELMVFVMMETMFLN